MKNKLKSVNFVSPINYSIFIQELPTVTKDEQKKIVANKIKKLYPGNINEIELFIIKNGKKKNSYIIIALNKNVDITNKILPIIYSLKNNVNIKEGQIIFQTNQFSEILTIKNYSLEKYNIIMEKSVSQLHNNEHDFLIDLSDDKVILGDQKKLNLQYVEQIERKRVIHILILLLIFTSILFLSLIIINDRKEFKNHQDKIAIQKAQEEKKQLDKLTAQLNSLKTEFDEIQKKQYITILECLKIICSNFTDGTQITQIDIINDQFKFDAISQDSLIILKNFENNHAISQCNLHQVVPKNNNEFFSISGIISKQNYLLSNEIDNDIKNQIEWYKKQIETYYNKQEILKNVSVSSIGQYIRSLILNNKGKIKNYQYNKNIDCELDFLFTIPEKKILDIISILSNNNQIIIVKQLSIRNNIDGENEVLIKVSSGNNEDNNHNYYDYIMDTNININKEDISNISKFFPSHFIKTYNDNIVKKEYNEVINFAPSNYIFISKVGTEDNGSVYIRDTVTNKLLKFYINASGNFSCYFETDEQLIFTFNNKKYRMQIK